MPSTLNPSGEAKIGILDSGVGGLSVLLEIRKKLPHVAIDYIGDSAWCPYGNKSKNNIQQRVFILAEHLIQRGAQLIVVACNSATIHTIDALRDAFSLPFVGMEPAVKPAAEVSRSNVIGVLATEASIAGEKFHHLLQTHAPASKIKVITRPCPRFVELVEEGTLAGPEVANAVRDYTQSMLDAGVDTLVLGCTHYPFLKPAIQSCVGEHISIICTGPAVANRVCSLLNGSQESSGQLSIFTTGKVEKLINIFPTLCPHTKASLEHLPLS